MFAYKSQMFLQVRVKPSNNKHKPFPIAHLQDTPFH